LGRFGFISHDPERAQDRNREGRMPMDRPHRWFAASCGLLLLVSTSGCRSTKSRIPPQPRAGAGRETPVQFSSDPSPPMNVGALGGSAPGLASPGMSSGLMGSQNPSTGGGGSGSAGNPADVPMRGLGNPASGGVTPREGDPNGGAPAVSQGSAAPVTMPGAGDAPAPVMAPAPARDRAPTNP
jgi:hypothetical protein